MSFVGMLIHQCTIERRTNLGYDDYGAPLPNVNWADISTVKCRYSPKLSNIRGLGGIIGEGDRSSFRDVVKQISIILLPNNTSINEQDRIRNIKKADGTVIVEGPLNVILVREPVSGASAHHVAAIVQEVT